MSNKKPFRCPVCGFDGLTEQPRDKHGLALFDICPCCGTEFGYDDAKRLHSELRKSWLRSGAHWWSSTIRPPKDWDPYKQLKRAGFPDK